MTEVKKTYKEMDVVAIPEAIPEIGMEAGRVGVVDRVWAGGKMLHVDASSPTAPSALVDLRVEPDGSLCVVGYAELKT